MFEMCFRDACKRSPSDEAYDSKTLYVPETYLKGQTAGFRQWWQIKSQHFDTILLFKVTNGEFLFSFSFSAISMGI